MCETDISENSDIMTSICARKLLSDVCEWMSFCGVCLNFRIHKHQLLRLTWAVSIIFAWLKKSLLVWETKNTVAKNICICVKVAWHTTTTCVEYKAEHCPHTLFLIFHKTCTSPLPKRSSRHTELPFPAVIPHGTNAKLVLDEGCWILKWLPVAPQTLFKLDTSLLFLHQTTVTV